MSDRELAKNVRDACAALNVALSSAADAGLNVDLDVERYEIATCYVPRTSLRVRITREITE